MRARGRMALLALLAAVPEAAASLPAAGDGDAPPRREPPVQRDPDCRQARRRREREAQKLSTREPAAPRALGVSHSRGGATPSTHGRVAG